MRDGNTETPNFLDKKDRRFSVLHKALDSLFRDRRTQNIGTSVKHAEDFTKEEEGVLWRSGVLGTVTPKSLLNAVFYLNGKSFCLRGGEEHRRLTISQIVREYSPDRYIYTEAGSKNKKGTFTERHISNKIVPIYAVAEAGERCHVHILDLYLSKIPKEAFERDNFYLRPLTALPANPVGPWFSTVPVGRNELARMVSQMCEDAGIKGHKTNHSLRATAASELFCANVPEKIIQERTGHRSLTALRTYEHITEQQHQVVSSIMAASTDCSYEQGYTQQPQPNPIRLPRQAMFNMQGCTVTINMGQQLPPQPPLPPVPALDFTLDEHEMLEFLKDF